LHELSTRLLHSHEFGALLEEVLDATIALLRADFGNVQLYDDTTASLHIVAHRGFGPDFLQHFARVDDATTAWGRALNRRKALIIEDMLRDAGFAPHWTIAASGFRSVGATPLFSQSGEPLGRISAHFRRPHRPRSGNCAMPTCTPAGLRT
jgi:GAF domain-containing protein